MINICSKILFIFGVLFFIAAGVVLVLNEYQIVLVANFDSILARLVGFGCLFILPNIYIRDIEDENNSGGFSVSARKIWVILFLAGVFFIYISFNQVKGG